MPVVPCYADWFRAHRHRLYRHGRGLDGTEPGRQPAAEFESAQCRVLLCRLSTYDDVLHSISYRMLYWAARQVPGVYVDTACFPSPTDAAVLKSGNVPWWLASGCKQPPSAFDVIAVSISTPQEAFNLPAALVESGLKLSRLARETSPEHPLVIIGGQAAGSVSFIHGDAEGPGSGGLADLVCFGDGIAWIQEFLAQFLSARRIGRVRQSMLDSAGALTGSWLPAPGAPMATIRVDKPNAWTGGYDGAFIPFADEDVEETIPLSFGCAYRCRFCQTGWMRPTFTATPATALKPAALRLKANMAVSDLNLLAADAASVSGIAKSVTGLSACFGKVSVKSLSIASLARSDMSEAIIAIEKHEFTLGVEGISARLRNYFGKQADERTTIAIVRALARTGLRQLKLFFILTGHENDRDIAELERLLRSVHAAGRCRVIASFTPLYIAPFTPLQFSPIGPLSSALLTTLERATARSQAEFRLSAAPDEVYLLNLMTRLGPAATGILCQLALHEGIRYDDTIPANGLTRFHSLAREAGIDLEALGKEHSARTPLPWAALRSGASVQTLYRSYKSALAALASAEEADPARRALARRMPQAHRSKSAPIMLSLHTYRHATPDQAFQPDVTLARGWLADVFRVNPAACAAYIGDPHMERLPYASGLMRLSARFRNLPGGIDGFEVVDPAEATAVWHAVLSTDAKMTAWSDIEAALRIAKVRYQVARDHADRRWLVVGESFCSTTGFIALCEREDGLHALCTAAAAAFLGRRVQVLHSARALALYTRGSAKCGICTHRTLVPLRSASADYLPLPCSGCILRTQPHVSRVSGRHG
jgi:hypothetical protein